MRIADVVSTRSPDPDTKHGAVIADQHHRILGVGYNGFPRGGPDHEYPTTRPDKYPYMVHAELNAILNCHARPEGATLYVTGRPCPECMKAIIQAGIDGVVYGPRCSEMVDEAAWTVAEALAAKHGVWLEGLGSIPPQETSPQETLTLQLVGLDGLQMGQWDCVITNLGEPLKSILEAFRKAVPDSIKLTGRVFVAYQIAGGGNG